MYCCIEHIIYSASRHIASYIITQIYHSNTSRMIVYYKKCKMYIKVYDTPTSKHVIKEKKNYLAKSCTIPANYKCGEKRSNVVNQIC